MSSVAPGGEDDEALGEPRGLLLHASSFLAVDRPRAGAESGAVSAAATAEHQSEEAHRIERSWPCPTLAEHQRFASRIEKT